MTNPRRWLLATTLCSTTLLGAAARAADPAPDLVDTADTGLLDEANAAIEAPPLVLAPVVVDPAQAQVDACAAVAANTKAPMYSCGG